MTRAPCTRRTGEALPLAEKFGDLITADGQGDGVSKACQQRVAADAGPNLRVCKHPCHRGGTRRGEKGELTSCRGTVQSQEG